MIGKVKELRKIMPVPVSEALELLKANDGDVETCVYLFKTRSIAEICRCTGCDEKTANCYYEKEKYDFNRTVSAIKNDIYDRNYKPIEGLIRENVLHVLRWLHLLEAEDLSVALDYKYIDAVFGTMGLIPFLHETGELTRKAKEAKDRIFDGYTDEDSLEIFVRLHKQLDDNEDYQSAEKTIRSKITLFEEELSRHLRNLKG